METTKTDVLALGRQGVGKATVNQLSNKIVLTLVVAVVSACSSAPRKPVPIYFGQGSIFAEGLSSAAWSPDGSLAAVANWATIWVVDTTTMNTVAAFASHTPRWGHGNTLQFIDDDHLVTTGTQGPATIWSISTHAASQVLTKEQSGEQPVSLAYQPETRQLAFGSYEGVVYLLAQDAEGHFELTQTLSSEHAIYDLAFSRNGTYLAAAGESPWIRVWDVRSDKVVAELPVQGRVTELELFGNDRQLLVAGEEIGIWKFMTEAEAELLEEPSMTAQKVAIATAATAAVALFVAMAPFGAPDLPMGGGGGLQRCFRVASVSPEGKWLIDRHPGISKEKIRVIDLENHEVIKSLNPRGGATCDIVFSPDGRQILLVTEYVARVYDIDTWEEHDFELAKGKELENLMPSEYKAKLIPWDWMN